MHLLVKVRDTNTTCTAHLHKNLVGHPDGIKMARGPMPIASMAAVPLDALPQLDNEHVALSASHRRDAMMLMADEHQRIATVESVGEVATVCLTCMDCPPGLATNQWS